MKAQWVEFRDGWKVVVAAAFGVGVGLIGAPFFSLGTFILPLSETFGWNRAQIGLASFCMVSGAIVTAPFVGRAADRFGVRTLAITSLLALAIAQMCMTFITGNIYTFYIGLVALSIAGFGTTPTIWTRGVATWFDQRRGTALGLTLAGTGIAAIVVPQYVGGLIAKYGWQAGYIGLAALTLLAVVPVVLFFFEAGRGRHADARVQTRKSGMETRQAVRTRRFWQLGIANFVVTVGTSASITHLVPLLSDAGMERGLALTIAGSLGVAIIVGRLSMGFLVDRLHAPYVAAAFIVGPAVACLILASSPSSLWWVLTAAILIGLAAGSEVDVLPYLTSRFFGLKSYGEIFAWQFVLFELAVGVGPMLAGRVYDDYGSYRPALYVGAAGLVAAAIAIGTLGKPPRFESKD